MYNCNITIEPTTSTAIDRIEWNSQTEEMCVFYVDNTRCYDYSDISWNDMLDLESKALVSQSWGKAFGAWKRERDLKFTIQAKDKFDTVWSGLRESDKKLYAQWAQEAWQHDAVAGRRKAMFGHR